MRLLNRARYGKITIMTGKDYSQIIQELIWEEISHALFRPDVKAVCLGGGNEFFRYLAQNLSFPLKMLSNSPRERYDLIVGWQIPPGSDLSLPYRSLRQGGTANLYGFYSQPSSDDILIWERKLRAKAPGATLRLPLPRALSLARIASWLKDSPFEHYNLSKKGIYYRIQLTR